MGKPPATANRTLPPLTRACRRRLDPAQMSARGDGRASRGSSRASATSPSSSAGLSGGVGGLDLEAMRYKDMVYTFKKQRREDRLVCISHDAWESWLAYWDSPEVTKKVEISSKNRMSKPDGPGTGIVKHKGESRCAHAHAAALKSKRIADEVRQMIEQRSQVPPDSSEVLPDTTSNYIDVVGVEKRLVFRLINRAAAHIGCSQRSSSADSVGSQYYDSQAAIQELQA
ncbi:hypothetical protein C2S52_001195 [Perilla frutescens var. hirtella]|nr:hypothetical protein C2S51_007288 [Perilla frutescens var. frutescens]KAH6800731.1 hypothetical protein C2S52_001195 [Perilla frutescens var. hirtella]